MSESSNGMSFSAHVNADAISRRAYELWEQEGRPENSDLRHWLQAEQELANQSNNTGRPADEAARQDEAARTAVTDARPLQGTRAASAANREPRRSAVAPLNGDKNTVGNSSKRKSASAPVM